MHSTTLRRGLVIALAAAAFPSTAQALPLELAARSGDDSVRYELTNKSPYATSMVQFRAPNGGKFTKLDDPACEAQDNVAFCQAEIAPGATKTFVATGQGLGPGTEHEACAQASDPPVSGCTKAVSTAEPAQQAPNSDAKQVEQPPTPAQSTPTGPVVATPPPVGTSTAAIIKNPAVKKKCKCTRISVGVERIKTKTGRVRGASLATITDGARDRAGFMLRWTMTCTGAKKGNCGGKVTVLPPAGVTIDANRSSIACKGKCPKTTRGQMFVRMSGAAATARTKPLSFTVKHACKDGKEQTTTLTFAFDRFGNVDVKNSDLGADIPAPPKKK